MNEYQAQILHENTERRLSAIEAKLGIDVPKGTLRAVLPIVHPPVVEVADAAQLAANQKMVEQYFAKGQQDFFAKQQQQMETMLAAMKTEMDTKLAAALKAAGVDQAPATKSGK